MGWPVLGPLVVAGCMLGVLFGGVEVATVAFAEELGAKAAAGPLLGVFALGSLLSGVATGAITWRARNTVRFRRGCWPWPSRWCRCRSSTASRR